MNQINNLEHERAKEAWSCIDYINTKVDDIRFKKEYRSILMKLPTMIITNGLGQALAFLKAKGKGEKNKPEEKVYQNIQAWLFKNKNINWTVTDDELIARVIALPTNTFRIVTFETLYFLSWLKRFADAVLPKEED